MRDWATVIPEQKTVLDGAFVTSDWIVAQDREDVLSRLTVYDKAGKRVRELALPVFGNVSGAAYDHDTDRLYATVASHTAPYKVYALDGGKLDWTLVWQDDPPLDMSAASSPSACTCRRRTARRSPCSSCAARTRRRTARRRRCSCGYGGFNIGVEPFYLGSFAAFVNRGGIYRRRGRARRQRIRRDVAQAGRCSRTSRRRSTT